MNTINKVLELSKSLILIKSDPQNKPELEEALELVTSNLKDFNVEKFESKGYKSILAYNSSTRPEKFKVILNGHLDVIPGKDYQYFPEIKDGKLYGVGSMDMKSNVACLVQVFKDLAKEVDYPIGLQIVTDEEIGGFEGTKYQIENGVRADFVIAGETTNFDIVNQAKGVLWLKVSCSGKTAHGAYPWRGDNAIWKMNNFLFDLSKKYPVLEKQTWQTSLNLAKIETNNQTFNKIPDSCTAWLDIRFVPEESENILEEVKKIIPNKGFDLEIVAQESALFVEKENIFLQKLKSATSFVTQNPVNFYGAQGSSDSRHYTAIGGKGVEFGPIGGGIGTDQEWVDIQSLETYYLILKKFLLDLK